MISSRADSFSSSFLLDRVEQHLDLSLNPINSSYLTPLSLPGSRIEHLVLDETGVDSGLGEVLVGCKNLDLLSLKASKVDGELHRPYLEAKANLMNSTSLSSTVPCLFRILQACPRISTLDLTSVRGVPLLQRRNFFQVSRTSSLFVSRHASRADEPLVISLSCCRSGRKSSCVGRPMESISTRTESFISIDEVHKLFSRSYEDARVFVMNYGR